MGKKFAIIGVGGYIAPRHVEAIKDLGGELVAAFDINDSVGFIDRFFPDCQFFSDFERFEAYFDLLRGTDQQVDYVSICTPNYMHAAHIRFALSHGAHAICEKPLVLTEKEVDDLETAQKKYGKNVYAILQLRVHDAILSLKNKIESDKSGRRFKVDLNYITSRGQWYYEAWKGDIRKSGGLSTNIGIHFFDMLTFIFGAPKEIRMDKKTESYEQGYLALEKADIHWFLSIDRKWLPPEAVQAGKTTFRSLKIDGEEFEFSEGFTELHKRVYQEILEGKGFGTTTSRPAIAIAEKIRGIHVHEA